MPINNAHAEAEIIADEFGFFDDWEDRYQMLIDQGRKLAPIPEKYRHDDFRLRGCQSVVYFVAERDPGDKITFMAQSDAAIVQGLVALLLRVYSGRTAKEILETEHMMMEDWDIARARWYNDIGDTGGYPRKVSTTWKTIKIFVSNTHQPFFYFFKEAKMSFVIKVTYFVKRSHNQHRADTE